MTINLNNLVAKQGDAALDGICISGFVNRRSGVQSPHPAPHKTAYFRGFSPVSLIGMGGIDGTSQRFIQPQKPEQLFPVRSTPSNSWVIALTDATGSGGHLNQILSAQADCAAIPVTHGPVEGCHLGRHLFKRRQF